MLQIHIYQKVVIKFMMNVPVKKRGRPRKMPDAETLVRLYADHTSRELGEMYNTSPATIRAWICRIRKGGAND